VCHDSDYKENDFQPPDEDDEPDTLDESVPSKCLFTKLKQIKKQSKDGQFDICGYRGEDPKLCMCKKCNSRRIAKMSMYNYHGNEYIEYSFESNYLATKLEVKFADKDLVKSKGALWSQKLKCWYVKLSNPNYTELVETY
jgi:hypothetical protein